MDTETEIARAAAQIRTQRAQLAILEARIQQETSELLKRLPNTMGIREIAALVGLSPARVGQMLKGRRPVGRPRKPENA